MVQPMPFLGPLWGGLVAGVLHTVLGPAHLCTIVTLSACQGARAFWFGVRWACGHLAGMAVIASFFVLINAHFGATATKAYEHYADYVMGLLLMFFGAYFWVRSEIFFDKTWAPKRATCACHHPEVEEAEEAVITSERQPLLSHQHEDQALRALSSTLIGFAQGVACPAGVVSLAFLTRYASDPLETCLFTTTFLCATTLAMGCLAMAYGALTQHCLTSGALAQAIYVASCVMSIVLGGVWIFLTAIGSSESLHGHTHGPRGHTHAHAVRPVEVGRSVLPA
mmetsp:Transcript_29421/g.62629  ORF Transcript_29421/g.62629 Transcript_29421/m.62629 type:complete len:281 (-) Transcript_29421:81-923(-)